jgi:SAM-dependent methyltransferase
VFLTERGYRVTGYDVIPEAIGTAHEIAAARGLPIEYAVVDVTRIPHEGEQFDLIVDSYCINHIVFAEERSAVFESVRARLKPDGYYLISSSMYSAARHTPENKVIDDSTGSVYDVYDGDCLYDPTTDYYYEPIDDSRSERCENTIVVNGISYYPARCYRNPERFHAELASHGFDTILYQGEFGQDMACVHAGSGVGIA